MLHSAADYSYTLLAILSFLVLQLTIWDRRLGTMLSQIVEGEEHPILYVGRKLSVQGTHYWERMSGDQMGSPHHFFRTGLTLCSGHALLQWLHHIKDGPFKFVQFVCSGGFPLLTRGRVVRQWEYVEADRGPGQLVNDWVIRRDCVGVFYVAVRSRKDKDKNRWKVKENKVHLLICYKPASRLLISSVEPHKCDIALSY